MSGRRLRDLLGKSFLMHRKSFIAITFDLLTNEDFPEFSVKSHIFLFILVVVTLILRLWKLKLRLRVAVLNLCV